MCGLSYIIVGSWLFLVMSEAFRYMQAIRSIYSTL
jgi:hypothetical protein